MTRTTARLARLTGGLVVGAVVLTGCGGGMDMSEDTADASGSSSASADFNDADVAFAQGMIVHHQGALEMAQLAEGRAEDPRVLDLAGRIEAAQQPEIDTMTGWLEDWGQPTSAEDSGDMEGMDMGGTDMGGMGMSDEAMSELENASGAEFDRMFLEMMTEHHRSAVEMAQTEVDEGQNAEATDLASTIIEDQTAEIDEMETLLSELGG